jgi:hypothetical protein
MGQRITFVGESQGNNPISGYAHPNYGGSKTDGEARLMGLPKTHSIGWADSSEDFGACPLHVFK